MSNADQVDTDEDGLGDPCDEDDDSDGFLDQDDNCPLVSNSNQQDENGEVAITENATSLGLSFLKYRTAFVRLRCWNGTFLVLFILEMCRL